VLSDLTFSFNFSLEYLQANGHDTLRVLALHEMGNLQFYTGNTRLEICVFVHVLERVCSLFMAKCLNCGCPVVSSPGQRTHAGVKL